MLRYIRTFIWKCCQLTRTRNFVTCMLFVGVRLIEPCGREEPGAFLKMTSNFQIVEFANRKVKVLNLKTLNNLTCLRRTILFVVVDDIFSV